MKRNTGRYPYISLRPAARRWLLLLVLAWLVAGMAGMGLLAACVVLEQTSVKQADVISASKPMVIEAVTPTSVLGPVPTLTPAVTLPPTSIPATATLTPVPSPTAFDNPLAAYTIDALAAHPYDGGVIQLETLTAETGAYERWEFSYTSDGLYVTGQAHLPAGHGPFPVIILLHGGVSQEAYQPGWGTVEHADFFARRGYLTLAPDYRSYNNTEGHGSPLKIPWAIDVMNLIRAVPTLPQADQQRIGVLGHSRGGGIAEHIMVLSGEVGAVSLYAPLSTDQAVVWRAYHERFGATWPAEDAAIYGSPDTNPMGYALASPINYLDRVRMPVQIHHGSADGTVPAQWSRDLYARLMDEGVEAEYFEYPGADHRLAGGDYSLFLQRNLDFFDRALGVVR